MIKCARGARFEQAIQSRSEIKSLFPGGLGGFGGHNPAHIVGEHSFFMPLCGATFAENSVLPWARGDFSGVSGGNRPTPVLSGPLSIRHPSDGGETSRAGHGATPRMKNGAAPI